MGAVLGLCSVAQVFNSIIKNKEMKIASFIIICIFVKKKSKHIIVKLISLSATNVIHQMGRFPVAVNFQQKRNCRKIKKMFVAMFRRHFFFRFIS